MDVVAREKEIRFSSRTRQIGTQLLRERREHEAMRRLLAKLPDAMRDDPDVVQLKAMTRDLPVNIVQLIYRANIWEGGSRDYEFSGRTMAEHWAAGQDAVAATMDRSELVAQNILSGKSAAFDLTPR